MIPVTTAIIETYKRGEYITRSWLYKQIDPLIVDVSDRKFERNKIIGAVKKELLTVNIGLIKRNGGYYLLHAHEHADTARDRAANSIDKAFQDAEDLIDATDEQLLSRAQLEKKNNASSDLGRMRLMVEREMRHVGVSKRMQKEQTVERKSGKDSIGNRPEETVKRS